MVIYLFLSLPRSSFLKPLSFFFNFQQSLPLLTGQTSNPSQGGACPFYFQSLSLCNRQLLWRLETWLPSPWLSCFLSSSDFFLFLPKLLYYPSSDSFRPNSTNSSRILGPINNPLGSVLGRNKDLYFSLLCLAQFDQIPIGSNMIPQIKPWIIFRVIYMTWSLCRVVDVLKSILLL